MEKQIPHIYVCPNCKTTFSQIESHGDYTTKCYNCETDCSNQNPIQPSGICEGWSWQDVEDQMS